MQSRFLIAVGAGLVSGLLFRAANQGAGGLLLLVFLTPLPIAIAGFGWGWLLSAIGAVVAFGLLTATASVQAGAFHLLLFGLPITASIYYLLLNRAYTTPNGVEEVEWYPIGRVLFGVALFSGVVGLAALLSMGTSVDDIKTQIQTALDAMLKADFPWPGGKPPTAEQQKTFVDLMTLSFSSAIAGFWLWVIVFNLWVGAKVARASGLLIRPWPNVSMTALPGWAGLPLALAMLVSMSEGYIGFVALGFGSGLMTAFMLIGLAIVHNVTWNSPFRIGALIATYTFLLLFFPFSALAIAALALIEPFISFRKPENGGQPPDPPSSN